MHRLYKLIIRLSNQKRNQQTKEKRVEERKTPSVNDSIFLLIIWSKFQNESYLYKIYIITCKFKNNCC